MPCGDGARTGHGRRVPALSGRCARRHARERDRRSGLGGGVPQALAACAEQGIRPDYPYVEPDGYDAIIAEAAPEPSLGTLPDAEYVDRIRGAWFGAAAAGVVLGKPLEMGYDRAMIRQYLESVDAYPLADWVPARSEALDITLRTDCLPSTRGNVRFTQPDDDIHYSVLALLLAEQKGLDFRRLDVGMQLLHEVPIFWLWGAHHQMYWHLVRAKNHPDWEKDQETITDAQLDEMRITLNPWREWIDGQLKADVWGYITPGQPRLGARYAGRLRQHGADQERDLRRHVCLRLRQRRAQPQPGRAYNPGRRPVGDPAALAAGGGRAQRERLVR